MDVEVIRERLALYRGPTDHEFVPVNADQYPRFCVRCGGNEHVHLYREHVAFLLAELEKKD